MLHITNIYSINGVCTQKLTRVNYAVCVWDYVVRCTYFDGTELNCQFLTRRIQFTHRVATYCYPFTSFGDLAVIDSA